jgi:hypothetical protein
VRVLSFEGSAKSVGPTKIEQTLTHAAEVIAIRPLLYPLAKSIEATAYLPDGSSEVMIWVKDYKFDWQPSYEFRQPIALPKGTRIEVVAHLDGVERGVLVKLCELTLVEKRRGL